MLWDMVQNFSPAEINCFIKRFSWRLEFNRC